MNYYYDCEFLEGTQKTWTGVSLPTIDLISIGIVAEDGREYYAISKDFNLKEAWNRFDIKQYSGDQRNKFPKGYKVYWIRENVLKPIWLELTSKEHGWNHKVLMNNLGDISDIKSMNYNDLKRLITLYGKSREEIKNEVYNFCKPIEGEPLMWNKSGYIGRENTYTNPTFGVDWIGKRTDPVLYGYYSSYDHVALCWLFGKMIDLPSSFPMYTRDLKQLKDEIIERAYNRARNDFERKLILDMDSMENYPKQTNEHNALSDARWNKQLHEFLKQLN